MSDDIVNVNQYIRELKTVIGDQKYSYGSLPKKFKIKKFHFRAIHRGYIKCVFYGGSSKDTLWVIL